MLQNQFDLCFEKEPIYFHTFGVFGPAAELFAAFGPTQRTFRQIGQSGFALDQTSRASLLKYFLTYFQIFDLLMPTGHLLV